MHLHLDRKRGRYQGLKTGKLGRRQVPGPAPFPPPQGNLLPPPPPQNGPPGPPAPNPPGIPPAGAAPGPAPPVSNAPPPHVGTDPIPPPVDNSPPPVGNVPISPPPGAPGQVPPVQAPPGQVSPGQAPANKIPGVTDPNSNIDPAAFLSRPAQEPQALDFGTFSQSDATSRIGPSRLGPSASKGELAVGIIVLFSVFFLGTWAYIKHIIEKRKERRKQKRRARALERQAVTEGIDPDIEMGIFGGGGSSSNQRHSFQLKRETEEQSKGAEKTTSGIRGTTKISRFAIHDFE
ncbi:hypothetical protein AA313_de0201341 [Arthrobotrys entomopaga]|nr:hypothetical protein AA313_de0201341 [Arthrobotrys entomopaga]